MSPPFDKKTRQPREAPTRGFASPPCYQHELDPHYLGATGVDRGELPDIDASWETIRAWRVKTRSRLIAFRMNLTVNERMRRAERIVNILQSAGTLTHHQRIGFYWPMKGEIDLRPLLATLVDQGIDAALPVVTEPNRPLEFWRWRPGDNLDNSGPMGIPVPATRQRVDVTALVIPLVGFDAQGHRLGHGGGYYDRTLADMQPRPWAIGVGFEECRLRSIFPQAHDIPLDLVVTQAGAFKTEANSESISPAARERAK